MKSFCKETVDLELELKVALTERTRVDEISAVYELLGLTPKKWRLEFIDGVLAKIGPSRMRERAGVTEVALDALTGIFVGMDLKGFRKVALERMPSMAEKYGIFMGGSAPQ